MSEPCSQQALINKINHSQGFIEGSVKQFTEQGKINQGMHRDLMTKIDKFIEKVEKKHQEQDDKIEDVRVENSNTKGWVKGAGFVFGGIYACIGLFLNWFKYQK